MAARGGDQCGDGRREDDEPMSSVIRQKGNWQRHPQQTRGCKIIFRVTPSEVAQIRKIAASAHTDVSDIVRGALKMFVEWHYGEGKHDNLESDGASDSKAAGRPASPHHRPAARRRA